MESPKADERTCVPMDFSRRQVEREGQRQVSVYAIVRIELEFNHRLGHSRSPQPGKYLA